MAVSSEEFRRQLGRQIRALRVAKAWSQEDLAERAGLSYKFIGEVERGVGNPSIETVFEIAKALGEEPVGLFAQANTTPRETPAAISRDRLFSAREALDSLDELLQELSKPVAFRKSRAGRNRRRRGT